MSAIENLARKSHILRVFVLIAGAFVLGAALSFGADDRECRPANLRTVNWSTEFCQSIVDFDEILVGNPVKDGIPAVSDPALESVASAAEWLSQRSPVIAVDFHGDDR